MAPTIPFEFDPPTSDYEELLKFSPEAGGRTVSWELIGKSVFVPDMDGFGIDLSKVQEVNKGRFCAYGGRGFSLDNYHEFFVQPPPGGARGFKMGGGVEATFGDASPLAAYLFETIRWKWNGSWDDISSVRIIGAEHEDGEIAYLNALLRYFEHSGQWPLPLELGEPDWEELDAIGKEETFTHTSAMVANLEPLRFLGAGMSQDDEMAASVYFYRVIEYFAFFSNSREISALRHDQSLSDHEFNQSILELLTREEKGAILRTIIEVADGTIINSAKADGLIPHATAQSLAESLYAFRNSIVHGKYSSGIPLVSGSALSRDPQVSAWRNVMLHIARKTLGRFGTLRA